MVLNKYRKNVDSLLTSLSKPFMKMHPNTITLISLFISFLAAISYYLTHISSYFLFAFLAFLILASLMDAIDGKVARLRGISSNRGDFLDHLIDRYADMIIIIGISLSPYSTPLIGLFALSGVFMTSYVGTQAQAVGVGRIYGGILGRADRLVILMLLPIIQFFWWGYYFSISSWILILFAVLGHITAIQRILSAWKSIPS
ncbi:CDP-alcohol phosphatidyltransferase family protein [Candidatus Aciduliprofundum boonei]|uniref:CDP-alcohol phosphatidyltransferase n=1 Tax=Aciduliprofundum boonei (strain DSM 19572 / T469) TaxID=439481 RepID=D3TAA7_ACIB4|nr:CDP-alcohol phosphatidyltransferase family protein [Candidatus Aciduliprofundum boonei]ADD09036.1 CDP-alcohol phosphatidyltransferase [Aciduliprofundum boonei T469]HII54449.1 CDP-alcohol phosphatidyltransferase family protein [Candidatus Aciduliprofundum boonei]